MTLTDDDLNYIYEKTNGYCYYCGKKLSWKNYGMHKKKGAWHADHSKPKSKGGTDYLRNLVPACISCNQNKSNYSSGSNYKRKFAPTTLGGELVDLLGLPKGFLGASRRRVMK